MSTLGELRTGIAATLSAAGIRATTDPRNVNPPCVIVGMGEGTRLTACAFEGTIPVWVIAPGAGHADAADYLDVTASQVAGLIYPLSWSAAPYEDTGLLAIRLPVPAAWEVTPAVTSRS